MVRFYKGKRKRVYKRKGRRMYKRRGKNKMSVWKLKSNMIIPDKVMVKLPYTDVFTTTGAVNEEFTFRGNSLFDPDQTGVGTQPLGFDQYSVFFQEYRVYASKLTMEIINASAQGVQVTVIPSKDANGSGSFVTSIQQPYVKYRVMSGTDGQDRARITNYMSTEKFWGRKVSTEDNFAAAINNNPINQWFWVCEFHSSDNTTIVNVDILLKIEYWAEFSNRKILAAS